MTIQVPVPGLNPGDPDGTATLREPHEVTERYRRPLKNMMVQLNPARLGAVIDSDESSIAALQRDVGLTDHEATILNGLGDHVIVAVLADWTLDRPLPRNADEMLDLPGPLYDALQEATAPIGAALLGSPGMDVTPAVTDASGHVVEPAQVVDPFAFNEHTVDDPTSPTGASDA